MTDHGKRLTYNRGCRCQDCRDAAARYERGRQWDILRGKRRHVSIVGPRRRLQALCVLGWSFNDQAKYLGVSNEMVQQWGRVRTRVTRETAARIDAMFTELSMRLPPEDTGQQRAKVAKTRNYARRNGWAPPLAWDDIDDADEKPKGLGRERRRDLLAEVAHLRALGESEHAIARQLGVTVEAIERAEMRANRRAS